MKNTKTKTIFVHSSHVENSLTQTSKSELISLLRLVEARWSTISSPTTSPLRRPIVQLQASLSLSLSLSLCLISEKKKILKFSLFASPIVYQVKIDQTLTLSKQSFKFLTFLILRFSSSISLI